MGKKLSTKTKPNAPAKRKVKPVAKVKAVAPSSKTKSAAVKPTARASKAKRPTYTTEDVALRAYFIAEKRHLSGIPGDPHHDWIQAEKQLAAGGQRARRPKARKPQK